MNHYTYPYYLTITQNSIINKFINANEMIELSNDDYYEKIIDECFNYLINSISDKLKNK